MRRVPARLVENTRRLRRDATDAEDLLWQMLRGRRFGGFKFRRQVPVQPFILDLYCPSPTETDRARAPSCGLGSGPGSTVLPSPATVDHTRRAPRAA
ncbi:MAG: DUF559 domain-containing protein [Myxococcales bacterium]|nr:DUF559 domain-containing protein [Myxococcales bacterium]